jgi:hypothetical protein
MAGRETLVDWGTSPLGWMLLFVIPTGVLAVKAGRADKGKRWIKFWENCDKDVRDVFLVSLACTLFIFSYELFWKQPARIRMEALEIQPPPILFHAPSSPLFLPGTVPLSGLKTNVVKLIFTYSPLFTLKRRNMYTQEINDFYKYLVGIGYSIPKDCPPIGESPGNAPSFAHVEPGSMYDGKIGIPKSDPDDSQMIVWEYSEYVFSKLFPFVPNDVSASDFNMRARLIYEVYYVNSFTGKQYGRKGLPHNYWGYGLWDIRTKYGKNFADKLLFFTQQRWHRPEGTKESFDKYFAGQIILGLDVMGDTPVEYVGPVFKIFEERGLPKEIMPL